MTPTAPAQLDQAIRDYHVDAYRDFAAYARGPDADPMVLPLPSAADPSAWPVLPAAAAPVTILPAPLPPLPSPPAGALLKYADDWLNRNVS